MFNVKKKTGMSYFVYILKCSDDTYYTGYTPDIDKRLETHRSGCGSKYVRSRLPVDLVYMERFRLQKKAMQREYMIKQLPRSGKEALINSSANQLIK